MRPRHLHRLLRMRKARKKDQKRDLLIRGLPLGVGSLPEASKRRRRLLRKPERSEPWGLGVSPREGDSTSMVLVHSLSWLGALPEVSKRKLRRFERSEPGGMGVPPGKEAQTKEDQAS